MINVMISTENGYQRDLLHGNKCFLSYVKFGRVRTKCRKKKIFFTNITTPSLPEHDLKF